MIVVDASAAIELVLQTPRSAAIESILQTPETTLHAPHLIDLEVLQVLRRYLLSSEISKQRAEEARRDFFDLDLNRYPHHTFESQIWKWRDNFTAYDAAYLVLAEILDARLLTMDSALENVQDKDVQVVVIEG